ncbi:hypothetical protein IM40_07150 [Candidatus Paracaedimonas acanthamoebae]|nr:hypothetical protein IM40_07150 [Candidatus Paracaedimonas acanthamoebae]
MRILKSLSIGVFCYLISDSLCFATSATEEDSAFFRSVCVYQYDDNPEKDTQNFYPDNKSSLEEQLAHFGPVSVNLIDRELGNDALDKLIPYAHWIHGLFLADNYFTDAALEKLGKFPELKYLDLSNNSFTRPSLESLTTLKNLSCLKLTYNRFSPKDIEELATKMPKTQIIIDAS